MTSHWWFVYRTWILALLRAVRDAQSHVHDTCYDAVWITESVLPCTIPPLHVNPAPHSIVLKGWL